MEFKKLNLGLIAKHNVNGPRYTSYPTALQFGDFGEEQYKSAVEGSINKHKDISLYCHLPFCNTICYYCACNKVVTKDKSRAAHYLDLLKKEMSLQAPLFTDRKVSQLHWGGGTPTFLSDEEITELMDAIRYNFRLVDDSDGEFSIEIDPRTVTPDRIKLLRQVGFNRISLGIQDFDPDVQKAVNRIQSVEATESVINAAREQDFRSVSVDLMYGLPNQTMDSVTRTIAEIVRLDPDRISIYNYAHLPERFKPQRRIDALELPSAADKLDILMLCIKGFGEAGYRYIGMDHFAKPDDELSIAQQNGSLHRNFQGYSTYSESDLIAFGITGISSIGNAFAQNVKEIPAYEALINSGSLAVERGIEIDRDDQLRKAVIMQLICQFELNFREFEELFNIKFMEYFSNEIDELKPFQEDQLLKIGQESIKISETGRLLIRNICMKFDRYITAQPSVAQYSKAI